MKTITFQLPDETDDKEVKMAVAALLFEKGIFSSGQAAAFAGVSKRFFLETTGKMGVSIFHETPEDLI